MSYALFATEYRHLPNVEDASVWPLDARGEPKGERIGNVAAIFADEVTESLSGQPIGVGGRVMRVYLFIDTMQGALIAPHCRIRRESDGTTWTVIDCQKRVFETRYVCDCRREVKRA